MKKKGSVIMVQENEFPANQVKKDILAGKAVYGTIALLGEPALVEMIGYAGLDYVLIDTEHSPNTMEQVEQMVRAADVAKTTSIVRVTTNSPELILRALDVGAGGVLVPQVNTAAEAAAAVRAARYAPQGDRGLAGIVRAARYGFSPVAEYVEWANSQTIVFTQVEHVDAVENLDSILAVEGLDGIYVGPADLSQSMGCMGKFDDSGFRRTIHSIIEKTRRTDKWAGIFCFDADDAKYWVSQGAQFITIGADSMIFASGLKKLKIDISQ